MKTEFSESRAQFLRGNWRGNNDAIRPPWALSETQFIEVCDGCGDCISACPEKILIRARGRYPKIDFTKGECTFCKACLDSCPTEALQDAELPWQYVAEIQPECLSKSGVMCRTCGDVCDSRAITFKFELGGVSIPELNLEKCNGCGACLALCPVGSIKMTLPAVLAAQITENSHVTGNQYDNL